MFTALVFIVPAWSFTDVFKPIFSGFSVVTDPLGSAIASIVGMLLSGVGLDIGNIIHFITGLLAAPVTFRPDAGAGLSITQHVLDATTWLAGAIFIVSLVIGGAKVAITRKREELIEIFKGLMWFVAMSSMWFFAVVAGIAFSDSLTHWLWQKTSDPDMSFDLPNVINGKLTSFLVQADINFFAPLMILLTAVFMYISCAIQFLILLGRSILLLFFAGLGPIASAFSGTEIGRNYMRKIIGWTVAFLLYKPVAMIFYIGLYVLTTDGISNLGDDAGPIDFLAALWGPLAMMVMAIVAMPALIKLITPAMEGSGSGGGGGGGALSALASGAIAVSMMSSRSGGDSGADGSAGGSGASGAQSGGSGGSGGGMQTLPAAGDAGSAGGGAGASSAGGGAGAGAGGAAAAGAGETAAVAAGGAATGGALLVAAGAVKAAKAVADGVQQAAKDTASE